MKQLYTVATLSLVMVSLFLVGMVANADSLLTPYTLEYNYIDKWGTITISSITMTLENGDEIWCKSSYYLQSHCDLLIIKQNERVIDLLERLVEK